MAGDVEVLALHPLLWIEYAREISDDGRRRPRRSAGSRRASRRVVRGTAVKPAPS
ncbi:MAG: hypothetical protein U1F77_12555 [Kiritimatiellia bacterium]